MGAPRARRPNGRSGGAGEPALGAAVGRALRGFSSLAHPFPPPPRRWGVLPRSLEGMTVIIPGVCDEHPFLMWAVGAGRKGTKCALLRSTSWQRRGLLQPRVVRPMRLRRSLTSTSIRRKWQSAAFRSSAGRGQPLGEASQGRADRHAPHHRRSGRTWRAPRLERLSHYDRRDALRRREE